MNWAVLGLLIERPSYGYELFQRLGRRYSGVLEPKISQVYAALTTLERLALVEPYGIAVSPDAAPSRQPRLHYRATPNGAREFLDWLAREIREHPQHVQLMRQVAAAAAARHDGLEVIRELIDADERACVEEANAMPLPPVRRAATPAAAAAELVERLVLAARRGQLDAHFAWIDYARQELEAYAQHGRDHEPPGA